MVHHKLELLFTDFLISKGYSEENFVRNIRIRSERDSIYQPDLILADPDSREYIAVIEFKHEYNPRIEESVRAQFFGFYSDMGSAEIPGYLVCWLGENQFQIFEFIPSGRFIPISYENFPSKAELITRVVVTKKKEKDLLKQKEGEEKKQRNRRSRLQAFSALFSLFAGIGAAFISIYFQHQDDPNSVIVVTPCCDTLTSKYEILEAKVALLEGHLDSFQIQAGKVDTIKIIGAVEQFTTRLNNIESAISVDPIRTLNIVEIRNEIENLKQVDTYSEKINDVKIQALNDKIDVINSWVLGLLITVFGSIVGYFVTSAFSRSSSESSSHS